MGVASTRNTPKENLFSLKDAPVPERGVVLQVRARKVKECSLGGEITLTIYKQEQHGPTFVTATGITGNKHTAKSHSRTKGEIQ
ncbi:hypothetical protein FOXYSP1_16584 [Fusarium oxysporum f. sp. phaseoli]